MTSSDPVSAFHGFHAPGRILVLPNAWDAASARLIEGCGAPAIATTSAGVAWSHGYPDGQAMPFQSMVDTVAAVVRAVGIPVSADIEAGYSPDPAAVAANVVATIAAGAVGINLEDGNESSGLTADKIAAARTAAEREGVNLFINARTDTYLKQLVPPDRAVEETLVRAQRYRDAGASGLFVPRLREPAEIQTIAEAIDGMPLNVLLVPGLASIDELKSLGARRVSAGAALALVSSAATRAAADALLSTGRYDTLFANSPAPDMNALLAPTEEAARRSH